MQYASQYVSDEDAEELIQELMLFIWENRNSLFVEISLKSYLFMAVKHRCLNAIKRQLYHERVHSLIYDKIKINLRILIPIRKRAYREYHESNRRIA